MAICKRYIHSPFDHETEMKHIHSTSFHRQWWGYHNGSSRIAYQSTATRNRRQVWTRVWQGEFIVQPYHSFSIDVCHNDFIFPLSTPQPYLPVCVISLLSWHRRGRGRGDSWDSTRHRSPSPLFAIYAISDIPSSGLFIHFGPKGRKMRSRSSRSLLLLSLSQNMTKPLYTTFNQFIKGQTLMLLYF